MQLETRKRKTCSRAGLKRNERGLFFAFVFGSSGDYDLGKTKNRDLILGLTQIARMHFIQAVCDIFSLSAVSKYVGIGRSCVKIWPLLVGHNSFDMIMPRKSGL